MRDTCRSISNNLTVWFLMKWFVISYANRDTLQVMSRIFSLPTALMIQEDTNVLSQLGRANMLDVSYRILNFLVKLTQYYEMSQLFKNQDTILLSYLPLHKACVCVCVCVCVCDVLEISMIWYMYNVMCMPVTIYETEFSNVSFIREVRIRSHSNTLQ